jgi:hypothetical protein
VLPVVCLCTSGAGLNCDQELNPSCCFYRSEHPCHISVSLDFHLAANGGVSHLRSFTTSFLVEALSETFFFRRKRLFRKCFPFSAGFYLSPGIYKYRAYNTPNPNLFACFNQQVFHRVINILLTIFKF